MPFSEGFSKVESSFSKELELIPQSIERPAPEMGISHLKVIIWRFLCVLKCDSDDYWEVYHEALARIKHLSPHQQYQSCILLRKGIPNWAA